MSLTDTAAPTGFRPLLALSTRLAGVQLAQVALTTTDLVMMGTLNFEAVAAGGLAALLYNQIRTMCVGVVTPVGNLVAGAVGRHESENNGDKTDNKARNDDVRAVVQAAFAVATATGALAAGVVIGIGLLLPFLGQSPSIMAIALPMMTALAPGLIPMLWLQVLRQFAVGMHRAGSLLGVTIASIGVNLVLDGGFLYGWLGLPRIGVAGVGLATTLGNLVSFLAYLAIVRRDPQLKPILSLRGWHIHRDRVREIVRLGTPASLTYGSEAGITSVATVVMGTFGPLALAAHNLVNNITYIVYQISIGISQGSSILISRSVGRGDRTEPRRIASRAFMLSGGLQVVLAVVYLAAPRAVLGLYPGSYDAVAFGPATTLLFFGIAQQVTKGFQNIAVGLMRGLGDTKSGFRSSLIGYWGVGIPAMMLCAYALGWHAPGVWAGMCAGFGATAVLQILRFIRADMPKPQQFVQVGASSSRA